MNDGSCNEPSELCDTLLISMWCFQQESFNNVKGTWLHAIDSYAKENVQKCLVGNKCDMESERLVHRETAQVMIYG